MHKFSDVFSTTLKVVGALALISAGFGAFYLVMLGAASSGKIIIAASGKKVDSHAQQAMKATAADVAADARPTSMPETKWKKIVAAAIKVHCATEGMTQKEVERALGKPTEATDYAGAGSARTYVTENKNDCRKYQGDICIQYEQREEIVVFTQSGHVVLGESPDRCLKEPLFAMEISRQ